MSSDERQDSLAAQAAAWVPPWERAPRRPDREFQERAEAEAGEQESEPEEGEELGQAGLSEDDDFDSAFEGPNHRTREAERDESGGTPAVDGLDDAAAVSPVGQVPDPGVEEPALSEPGDESAGVDAPSEPGDESAGIDAPVGVPGREGIETPPGTEMPLPEPIEEAAEAADAEEPGTPVDAPLPAEGDDAGDVFDSAADDDVSDDGEMDLPFADEVPPSSSAEVPRPNGADEVSPSNSADDNDAGRAGHAAGRGESEPAESDRAENGRAEGADARGDRVEGAGGEGGADEASVVDATAAGPGAAAEGGDEPAKRAKGAKARAVPGQKRRAGEPLGTGDESSPRTGNSDVDLPGLTDDAELAGALEAIMLVVDEPVGELQLAQILEQPTERIAAMLDNLSARYTAAGHGFDLRRVAGGWRLYTRPEYAAYVERFVLDGQSVRLTQAALETLAVVAYKQPVTRSRISAIRGVNCDGVMRTLATRGLIEECGTESETGAHLYRTTGLFLEKLGLNSVDQLPPLAPFLPDDVEEVLDATG